MMHPMAAEEKSMEKRKEAIKARLEKLPSNNPIVKMAMEEKDHMKEKMDMEEKWGVVDKLVSCAYGMYMDEKLDFNKAVKSLGEAFSALA